MLTKNCFLIVFFWWNIIRPLTVTDFKSFVTQTQWLFYLWFSPKVFAVNYKPGKSHGWKSLVGCSPWGRKESDTTEQLHFHFSLSCIGEGNGNPLQCSCLENPRDREAWWTAICGVAQSQTRLQRLSRISSTSIIIYKNINNLRYADDTILMAAKWRIKEPLDESERGEWKSIS